MTFLTQNKVFLILFTAFLLFRLIDIGPDITNSDAIRWHKRSSNFLNALQQREFANTYQHYQPGVTLMWLNSVVKYVSFEYQIRSTDSPLTLGHAGYFPTIHGISKSLMIITLVVVFGFQLYVISKVFNNKIALFYGLLVATEPYLIGIDRWFHLTSFEVYFAFTSFLALLLWKKQSKNWLLVLSAILFSLAVYSKLTALLTALPLILIFLGGTAKVKSIKSLVIFGLISLITFLLLFPALWVEPLTVITNLYGAASNAIVRDARSIQLKLATPELFYPVILAFKLSPLVFILLLASLSKIKNLIKNIDLKLTIVYLIVFLIALTVADKKIDRYSLALFLPLILLVSYYLNTLKTKARIYFIILLLIQTFWFAKQYHPVYSAFYSPLFGGAEKALEIGVFENSGEYFSQAAQYLNNKEGNLLIGVPNNINPFAFNSKDTVTGDLSLDLDYIVWSYDIDRKSLPTYEKCNTIEKFFGTRDFNYLYIFACK